MSDRKDTIRGLQDQRKKLVEQRDEARAQLQAERDNLKQLLEDKETLSKQADHLAAELKHTADLLNTVSLEKAESDMLVEEMLGKFKALKEETVAQKEHYDAELAKLKLDDVATLKKRLAQKAEELRLMTVARDQHHAAAEKLKTERDQAHGVLALVPKPVLDDIKASLTKPKLVAIPKHEPRHG